MPAVINAGTPGDSSSAVLQKLARNLIEYKPETSVLSVGANDAVNPKMFVSLPDFKTNLAKIIANIRKFGSEVIYLIPPFIYFPEFKNRYPEFKGAWGDGIEEKFISYVGAAREVAAAEHVPHIDLYKIFKNIGNPGEGAESLVRNKANCGAYDGVHPTPQGHALIGALAYQVMLDRNMPLDRIVCLGDSITHGYPLAGMGTAEGDNYPSAINRLVNGAL